MQRWLGWAAALALVGCASDGYQYHDEGYWSARERVQTRVEFSLGWGACSPSYSPFAYPRYGYGWSGCGYGYGAGYGSWYGAGGGYWHDPYWSQPWYLPPRTLEAPRAGARARALAESDAAERANFTRYDDLAPLRRRDIGGGDRAYWPASAPSERLSAPSSQGLGSARYGNGSSGLSSNMNSGSGGRQSGSARSSNFPSAARSSAAGSATRSSSRDTREEQ